MIDGIYTLKQTNKHEECITRTYNIAQELTYFSSLNILFVVADGAYKNKQVKAKMLFLGPQNPYAKMKSRQLLKQLLELLNRDKYEYGMFHDLKVHAYIKNGYIQEFIALA